MATDIFFKCINEICAKAVLYQETGIIPVLDAGSCVLKSDTAITSDLKDELKRAVIILEDVPDHQKDWHPDSDGKVLDLVHPSLFPLIYKPSRILPLSTGRLPRQHWQRRDRRRPLVTSRPRRR
jgi:hypothetical protein